MAFLVMPSKLTAIKLACLLACCLGIVWVLIAVAMALLGWVIKTPKGPVSKPTVRIK